MPKYGVRMQKHPPDPKAMKAIAAEALAAKQAKEEAERKAERDKRERARVAEAMNQIDRTATYVDRMIEEKAKEGKMGLLYCFGEQEVQPEAKEALSARYKRYAPQWRSLKRTAIVNYDTGTDREYWAPGFQLTWGPAAGKEDIAEL